MRNRRVRVYSWLDKLAAVSIAAWLTVLAPVAVEAQSIIVASGGGAATSVSAAAFPLRAPDGSAAAPSYSFSAATGHGLFRSASGLECISFTGEPMFCMHSAATQGWTNQSDLPIGWTANAASADAGADTCLERVAAGVSGSCGAGTAAEGWIQNEAGDQFLTGNHTNATATPTDLTDLTVTVVSGRKYSFDLVLIVSQSVAADGARLDFEGGTAAATNFVADVTILDGAAYDTHTVVSALATDVTSTDIGTTVKIEAKGSFEPSGNGTFIPRIGLEAASTGTITTLRGSYFWVKDMP